MYSVYSVAKCEGKQPKAEFTVVSFPKKWFTSILQNSGEIRNKHVENGELRKDDLNIEGDKNDENEHDDAKDQNAKEQDTKKTEEMKAKI